MSPDLSPAPGRYPIPLDVHWTAVAVEPLPGRVALGLFLDGEPVEVIAEDEDARAHLRGLLRTRDMTRARHR